MLKSRVNFSRRALLLPIALPFLLAGCGAVGGNPTGAVDAAVRQTMSEQHIPGAAIAVVDGTQPAYVKGYGVANLASRRPVDAQTRFEIGSLTKQFTAAAILQLRERGKLSLDDTLGKYVPAFTAARRVTIRQMLRQVSGIPDMCSRGCTAEDELMRLIKRPGSFDAVLALVKDKPLNFPAGTKWQYSNVNYILLGRIVELTSGMSWERYVRTHIFVPAGMSHSSFTDAEAALSDMASGYYAPKSRLTASPPLNGWGGGAGAIVSTAGDLAKWDTALFGGKIISASDLKLMTTSGRLKNGSKTMYGFGLVIDQHDRQERIWHSGGTVGFASRNDIYPSLHEEVIVLTNALLKSGPADALADRIFAALHPDLTAAENVPAPGENKRVTARMERLWNSLAAGNVDRAQLTAQMRKKWTPEHLALMKTEIAKFGPPGAWIYRGKAVTNGLTAYTYRASFKSIFLNATMTLTQDGKLADFTATGSSR